MVGVTTNDELYYKATALGRSRTTAIGKVLVISKNWLHSHIPISLSCFRIITQIVLLEFLMFKQFVKDLMRND